MTAAQLSIYVSSFDDYADVLPHFFVRLTKHWPDCPYPVYLGGVANEYAIQNIDVLRTDAKDWSSGAIQCLKRIETKYVLLLLEDYLLNRKVDTAEIEKIVALMDRGNLQAVRLFPYPAPDVPMPALPMLGFQAHGSPNRIGTQATIWQRDALLDLLRPGESIWEFEIYGNIRSNKYAGIAGCWHPVLHYVLGVGRGKWFRSALRDLARDDIHPDLSLRPSETAAEEIMALTDQATAWILRLFLPLRWRQWIQQKINPGVYRY